MSAAQSLKLASLQSVAEEVLTALQPEGICTDSIWVPFPAEDLA